MQTISPPLSPAATNTILSYVEGEVFRGSRHMPMSDAITVLTEAMLTSISGLPGGPCMTVRLALRKAKQATPVAVSTSTDGSGAASPVSPFSPSVRTCPVCTSVPALLVAPASVCSW